MAEAVRAVRADFCFDHRATRTVFHAADVCTGERQVRSEILRRRVHIDEVFQPALNDLHASVLDGMRLQFCSAVIDRLRSFASLRMTPAMRRARVIPIVSAAPDSQNKPASSIPFARGRLAGESEKFSPAPPSSERNSHGLPLEQKSCCANARAGSPNP